MVHQGLLDDLINEHVREHACFPYPEVRTRKTTCSKVKCGAEKDCLSGGGKGHAKGYGVEGRPKYPYKERWLQYLFDFIFPYHSNDKILTKLSKEDTRRALEYRIKFEKNQYDDICPTCTRALRTLFSMSMISKADDFLTTMNMKLKQAKRLRTFYMRVLPPQWRWFVRAWLTPKHQIRREELWRTHYCLARLWAGADGNRACPIIDVVS